MLFDSTRTTEASPEVVGGVSGHAAHMSIAPDVFVPSCCGRLADIATEVAEDPEIERCWTTALPDESLQIRSRH